MMHRTIRAALAASLLACLGAADAQAQMVSSPASFDFGTVPTGATVTLGGYLEHVGGVENVWRLSSMVPCAGTSMEFGMPTGYVYVGRAWQYGQRFPFSVSYAPIDAVADAGCFELRFVDVAYVTSGTTGTAPTTSLLISVTGSGVGTPAPRLAVAGDFSFGRVAMGTTATRTVSIQNLGAGDLVIDAVALVASTATSGELVLAPPALPATVAPGASLPLSVAYAPVDTMFDAATVVISSNDPTAAGQVAVSGVGYAANLDLDVVSVNVPALAKARKPVTLSVSTANVGTMSGSATIEVVALQNGGEVYRSSLPVFTAAGDRVEYAGFGFTPRAKGTVTWTVTIADGDPDVDVATADTVIR